MTKEGFIELLKNERFYSYKDLSIIMECSVSTVARLIWLYNLKDMYRENKYKNKKLQLINILNNDVFSSYNDIADKVMSSPHKISKMIDELKLNDLYKKNRITPYTKIVEILKTRKYRNYTDVSQIYGCTVHHIWRMIYNYNLKELYCKNKR